MRLMEILNGPVGLTLGWTLLHLLWQATAVALILGAIRTLWREASSNVRYATALLALAIVLMLPALTFSHLWSERSSSPLLTTPRAGTSTTSGSIMMATGSASTSAVPSSSAGIESIVSKSLPWLVGIWMIGVALLATRLTVRAAWTTRLTHDRISEVEGSWHRVVARLGRKLGLARTIAIYESALVEVPTVVGWLRPVILVPTSVFTGLTYRQIETILAHELAHVRRHDALVNFLQSIVETLFFFHPAVWWISGRIRIEREHCCDDLAVSLCGNPVAYAKALTFLEEMRATVPEGALAATGGSLLERIRRIAGVEERDRKAPSIAALVLLMTLGGATAWALSKPEQETPSPEKTENAESESYSGWWYVTPPPTPPAPPAPPVSVTRIPTPQAPPAPPAPPAPIAAWDMASEIATAVRVGFGVGAAPKAVVAPGTPMPPGAPMPPVPPVARITSVAPSVAYTVRPDDFDEPDRRIGDELTIDDLIRLRGVGVTSEYLRALREAGFAELTIGEVVAMRGVGVTPEYIDAMRDLFGRDLSVDDLVSLRGVGVSTEWASSMKQYTGVRLTPEDAIRLRGVGASPEWIGTMSRVLGESLSLEDAVRLKGVGVSQEYVLELEKHGIPIPPVEDLIRLRGVGVTPQYIDSMRKAGFTALSIEDLVALRGVGVTPSYAGEMKKAGVEKIDMETLVRLRGVGVSPEYVKEMRAAGLSVSSSEDLIRLRGVGVTPDYVRSLRDAGMENVTIEKLIRLRGAGVDADFIREMKN